MPITKCLMFQNLPGKGAWGHNLS